MIPARPVSRRRVLGIAAAGGMTLMAGCASEAEPPVQPTAASAPPAPPTTSTRTAVAPDRALDVLIEGNRRFVKGQPAHQHSAAEASVLGSGGQQPLAFVLGCADSRVPPEALFDQGIGDLFVARTAGHLADTAVLGTLQYAVEKLAVPLIVVLGHERCEIVQAAIEARRNRRPVGGDFGRLVAQIDPAVVAAVKHGGSVHDLAMRLNVARVVAQLGAVPSVARRAAGGSLRVVGARYDPDGGLIRVLR